MSNQLQRALGVPGAVWLGLGSIVGTGVFVSIGIAAGVASQGVLIAIAAAAILATCNGLNSAQLAANYPVSGGTYEYAYRTLSPRLGFTAGWLYLLAKSASAATAALGFAGYTLTLLGADPTLRVPLALGAVVLFTALTWSGIRRSSAVNTAIVSFTLLSLALFITLGLPPAVQNGLSALDPRPAISSATSLQATLEATALMFVAYTGYGRVATLGEEVHEPAKTIPRAVIIVLLVSMVLYLGVGFVGVGSVGAQAFANATSNAAAPLEVVSRAFGYSWLPTLLAVGAITAMLGVLLNLILGLSRVLLAMGRRSDVPHALSTLNEAGTTPIYAVPVMGAIVAGLTLLGDLKTTWSFSAFTVLCYYALTNLSSMQLTPDQRKYPKWIAYLGLSGCLFLAFWVKPMIWVIGLGLLCVGQAWFTVADRRRTP